MDYYLHSFAAAMTLLIAPALIQRWDFGACVKRALERARIPLKTAAAEQGIALPQLSRMLSGCGPEHVSGQRLTNLPDRFWDYLQVEIAAERGLIEDADTRERRYARQAVAAARAHAAAHDDAEADDSLGQSVA